MFKYMLALALLFAPMAQAQEPEGQPMVWRGGIICDTLDELKTWLDGINNRGEQVGEVPEGCGTLRVHPGLIQQLGGMPMRATVQGTYENDFAENIVLAEFDFTVSPYRLTIGVQYGYLNFDRKPEQISL